MTAENIETEAGALDSESGSGKAAQAADAALARGTESESSGADSTAAAPENPRDEQQLESELDGEVKLPPPLAQ